MMNQQACIILTASYSVGVDVPRTRSGEAPVLLQVMSDASLCPLQTEASSHRSQDRTRHPGLSDP